MKGVGKGFIHTLVEDVVSAIERREMSDTEAHRREAIRTIFAAIEGVAWVYREHIRRAAKDLGTLTTGLEIALQEKSYSAGGRGELVEQVRYTPLANMIRFIARVAVETCQVPEIDFNHGGWAKLQRAIAIRNRLTHPKSRADLQVSVEEVETAEGGFMWLLALAIEGMGSINERLIEWNKQAVALVQDLKNGDPVALEEYRRAALAIQTDDSDVTE